MNESKFEQWAASRNVRESDVEFLKLSASFSEEDSLVGSTVLDYAGIVEYTDEEIVEACPFDGGFVVFGSCPNGDPVALDVQNEIGSVHYISHEESDGCSFPSLKVANSVKQFLEQLRLDKMPTDFHEAKRWNFSANRAE